MHLRRALLLFAIVLGFAAVAASLAPPPEDGEVGTTATDPAPGPEPAPEQQPPPHADSPTELRFVTGTEGGERKRIDAGERAVVTVAVQSPGQVEIPGLGLLEPAEPGTPARFDVLVNRPGRYEITFRPTGDDPDRVGILVVGAA